MVGGKTSSDDTMAPIQKCRCKGRVLVCNIVEGRIYCRRPSNAALWGACAVVQELWDIWSAVLERLETTAFPLLPLLLWQLREKGMAVAFHANTHFTGDNVTRIGLHIKLSYATATDMLAFQKRLKSSKCPKLTLFLLWPNSLRKRQLTFYEFLSCCYLEDYLSNWDQHIIVYFWF